MHHLAAFFGNIAQSAAYANIAAVADQGLSISSNSRFLPSARKRILGAWGAGASVTSLRIEAPSLRIPSFPEVYPQVTAVDPPDNQGFSWYGDYGLSVEREEELAMTGDHAVAGASDMYAALWLADRFTEAPKGPCTTLRAAIPSTTLTNGTWVTSSFTFNQTLASGEYAIIGMAVVMNDAQLARLVFPDGPNVRPGVLTFLTYGNSIRSQRFRFGNAGLFGKFRSTAQPTREILGGTAGAETGTLFLDVVPLSR